jgi:formamidopyrimidine-DNA glycosylase
MPELPDLEVFRVNLFNRLTSKRLIGLGVFNPRKVLANKELLLGELNERGLLRIDRVGKELRFDFGGRRIVSVHLMLNGEISLAAGQDGIDEKSLKIFSLSFENGLSTAMLNCATAVWLPAIYRISGSAVSLPISTTVFIVFLSLVFYVTILTLY